MRQGFRLGLFDEGRRLFVPLDAELSYLSSGHYGMTYGVRLNDREDIDN